MSNQSFDISAFSYAHRGLWCAQKPENSIAAFEAAAQAGLGCELDARVTADGELVVFHDTTLERMCGRPGRIDALSLQDTRKLRLPDGSSIPTLDEALEAMAGMPTLIEVKIDLKPGAHEPDRSGLPTLMRLLHRSPAPAAVMSFDELTMAILVPQLAGRPVGQLIQQDKPQEPDASLEKARRALATGCTYLGPELPILARVASSFPRLPLVSWTARTPSQLGHCRHYGAAPIFEAMHPDLTHIIGTSRAETGRSGPGARFDG